MCLTGHEKDDIYIKTDVSNEQCNDFLLSKRESKRNQLFKDVF